MDFFEEVDNMAVVSNHLNDLQKLEEDKATELVKTYKRIRWELRDRLDTIRDDTFTAQRIRGVLVQIESAIIAMEKGLLEDLDAQALSVAKNGVEDLQAEINSFSQHFTGAITPININAAKIAMETRNFLVNRYKTSIKSYSADVRQLVTQGLYEALLAQRSQSEVIRKIGQFFMAEEWKLRRIARTELHHVYNLSKINGMKDLREKQIPDLKKTLFHPMDSRTADDSKFVDRKELVVDIEKPFRYTYRGHTRIFMAPPDRPNDRSILIPYRAEWDS